MLLETVLSDQDTLHVFRFPKSLPQKTIASAGELSVYNRTVDGMTLQVTDCISLILVPLLQVLPNASSIL